MLVVGLGDEREPAAGIERGVLERLWPVGDARDGHDPEPRDVIVFSLFADELAGTPSAEARFEAWDAAGAHVM